MALFESILTLLLLAILLLQVSRRLRIPYPTLLAAAGLLVGTAASWGLSRLLGGFLFGVTATDPVTFLGMAIVLTMVAVTAGYLPARRASRIDPMAALRSS